MADNGSHAKDHHALGLERQLETLTLALENTVDSILVHDMDGRVIYFNGKAAESVGCTREEFAALPPWGFSGLDPEQRDERLAAIKKAGSTVFRSKSPEWMDRRVIEVRASYVEGGPDEEPVVVAVSHDITEQVRAQEILKHRAFHDALTGLANRALFEDRLELAMAGSRRHGRITGMVYIDVDDFKDVNDLYGHDMGDRVLMTLAERLKKSVREVDTAARFGGDEFVVVFPDLESPEGIEAAVRKLKANLGKPIVLGALNLSITCSMGVAVFDPMKDDARSLVMRADLGMYEAKRELAAAKRANT